jgi:type IV secretion system protein VirB9
LPPSGVAATTESEAAVQTAQLTIDQGLKLDDLKFRYRIEGDAPWKPLRAFDDGKKVYLQFPIKDFWNWRTKSHNNLLSK